jgi:hypothetical protein
MQFVPWKGQAVLDVHQHRGNACDATQGPENETPPDVVILLKNGGGPIEYACSYIHGW